MVRNCKRALQTSNAVDRMPGDLAKLGHTANAQALSFGTPTSKTGFALGKATSSGSRRLTLGRSGATAMSGVRQKRPALKNLSRAHRLFMVGRQSGAKLQRRPREPPPREGKSAKCINALRYLSVPGRPLRNGQRPGDLAHRANVPACPLQQGPRQPKRRGSLVRSAPCCATRPEAAGTLRLARSRRHAASVLLAFSWVGGRGRALPRDFFVAPPALEAPIRAVDDGCSNGPALASGFFAHRVAGSARVWRRPQGAVPIGACARQRLCAGLC